MNEINNGSVAVTRGVRIQVRPSYVPEKSNPMSKNWFFAYRIHIENEGDETVQLISRHWIIKDAAGSIEEVKGPGVIGEQPVLKPGQSFQYTSFCPLKTPFGSMEGSFQMMTTTGAAFDATVARFELSEPLKVN